MTLLGIYQCAVSLTMKEVQIITTQILSLSHQTGRTEMFYSMFSNIAGGSCDGAIPMEGHLQWRKITHMPFSFDPIHLLQGIHSKDILPKRKDIYMKLFIVTALVEATLQKTATSQGD